MTKKQCSLMIVLALLAGLVGGVLSSRFLIVRPAFAEKNVKVIEAQGFRLVDEKGKNRGEFLLTELGFPSLILRDEKELIRLHMAVALSGLPVLYLDDENGQTRATLQVFPEGDVQFTLGVQPAFRKEPAVRISVDKRKASLILFDEKGTSRTVLGNTSLEVERTGEVRQRPSSSLVFFDEKSNVIWQAP